ncbi:MAG: YciI family protein [Candidatus Dormibacteraeota bacterium]|nr:YciI family protein [Candidatus Dormibacteraeota bacterium]
MRYLCLVYPAEDFGPTPEQARQFLGYRASAMDAGVYLDAGRLQPPDTATTLRDRDGEHVLTDGPFAEIKEHLGGYVVLDCGDLDEAVAWAAKLPGVRNGAVEIRPLLELSA